MSAAESHFKLSTTIVGHTNDVRCVSYSSQPPGIVTASRDKTAKFWQLSIDERSYSMAAELTGHTQFVNTAKAVPPCRAYPEGVILTGSLDGHIRGFSFSGGDPVFTLKGHEKSVTCMNTSSDGTIISGSWDFTVRIWRDGSNVKTFKDHKLAIWDVTVMPGDQVFVSASADKSIKLFSAADWRLFRTLVGHEDVVRCVRPISAKELLSGANDGSIRRWNIDNGVCLGVYPAHEPFTYSLSLWKNGDFASSGEDRVIKVWKGYEVVQNVHVPTLTNWSVACLPNGDLAVGSNDGTVRIFSRAAERQAPEPEIKLFEQILSNVKIQAPELQGLDIERMPGKEALVNPGTRDGQTKLIKDNGNVTVYSWAAAESQWLLVGSVVGTQEKKKMYNGVEYDYLFDVDLGSDKPKLKLGYNKGEDPWVAAQRFINEQQLSQEFIDQVANFITSQTKEVAHLYPSAAAVAAADPFTGGSRYIPGSGGPSAGSGMGSSVGGAADPFTGASGYRPGSSTNGQMGGVDPFTGGSRYVPGGAPAPAAANSNTSSESSAAAADFPMKDYFIFSQGNHKAMSEKLSSFQSEQGDSSDAAAVMRLVEASETSANLSDQEFEQGIKSLVTMLSWPEDKQLPVLDALRLVVRHRRVNELLSEEDPGPVLRLIQKYVLSGQSLQAGPAKTNRLLVLRTLCNLFSHEPGRVRMAANRESVSNALPSILPADKNTQIAVGTLLLNYCILIRSLSDSETKDEQVLHAMRCALDALGQLEDGEAVYRLLVGLGTILYESDMVSVAGDFGVRDGLRKLAAGSQLPAKVVQCTNRILSML